MSPLPREGAPLTAGEFLALDPPGRERWELLGGVLVVSWRST